MFNKKAKQINRLRRALIDATRDNQDFYDRIRELENKLCPYGRHDWVETDRRWKHGTNGKHFSSPYYDVVSLECAVCGKRCTDNNRYGYFIRTFRKPDKPVKEKEDSDENYRLVPPETRIYITDENEEFPTPAADKVAEMQRC